MLNVEKSLSERFPRVFGNKPKFISRPFFALLRVLFHERAINQFVENNSSQKGLDFIESVLQYFNFSYQVSNTERENIPASGRVIIIANHPLGALDALALIKLVSEVRKDIKIVANELLMHLEPINNLLLPVDNFSSKSSKAAIKKIDDSLNGEEAVIIFPSGEVSRLGFKGIRDGRWKSGFLRLAKRSAAPILPVYINARNTSLFYGLSLIYKPLATLMLVDEMFRQRNKTIKFKIGACIPFTSVSNSTVNRRLQVKLIKKHLYRVARGKKGLLATENAIAHPESRQSLNQELQQSELLGTTKDGKQIYLFDCSANSSVMKEIGRLREVTFRKVGEGSGQRRDLDHYDQTYRQLVLWDEKALEIVGAYRIGEAKTLIKQHGAAGLYTSSLFNLGEGFNPYLENALELGRSFVQPRYWGSRALDYLWQGLGAYLKRHSDIRYLFGPVTISNSFPEPAKNLMVYFYQLYFGDQEIGVRANIPFIVSGESLEECKGLFTGIDYSTDFTQLKEHLSHFGVTVPTLYKQYSDLCEEGGVKFLDFGVDPGFSHCVDGFLLVDLHYLKASKRKRYIGEDNS